MIYWQLNCFKLRVSLLATSVLTSCSSFCFVCSLLTFSFHITLLCNEVTKTAYVRVLIFTKICNLTNCLQEYIAYLIGRKKQEGGETCTTKKFILYPYYHHDEVKDNNTRNAFHFIFNTLRKRAHLGYVSVCGSKLHDRILSFERALLYAINMNQDYEAGILLILAV